MTNQSERVMNEILSLGSITGHRDLALRIAKKGGNVSEFMAALFERSREKPLHDAADYLLGFDSQRDATGYSLTNALRAAMTRRWDNAGLEKEVSRIAELRSGQVPHGDFFVPFGLLARDFNVGIATQAGNLVSASRGNNQAIDPLRRVSITSRMGATWLTGCKDALQLPRVDMNTNGPHLEIAMTAEIDPTSSLIDLSPRRYCMQVEVSKQALIQSSTNLDGFFSQAFSAAIFESLDADSMNGTGTGADALGIRATPGVGDISAGDNGGLPTWALLCDIEDKTAANNCTETELSGWALNAKTRRYLRTLQRGANLPYCWDGGERPLLGHRAVVSNILPSDLEKGTSGAVCSSLVYSSDWSNLIIAAYGGGIDITVDPITKADRGKAVITASLYAGVGLARQQAFAKIDDLKTA